MFTLVWGIKSLIGKLGAKDERRLANGLGLWSEEMAPHWKRLGETWGLDGHSLINIGTEWTRLDPQRAWKVGMDGGLAAVLITVAILL